MTDYLPRVNNASAASSADAAAFTADSFISVTTRTGFHMDSVFELYVPY